MRIEIPICPECEKELSEDATECRHCLKPIAGLKFRTLSGWRWLDRVFLMGSVFMMLSFFLPWFPGDFLSRETALSPVALLLNLIDLEVDFLASYDILRMVLIVPVFSLFIFFMVYMGDRLKNTPFPMGGMDPK